MLNETRLKWSVSDPVSKRQLLILKSHKLQDLSIDKLTFAYVKGASRINYPPTMYVNYKFSLEFSLLHCLLTEESIKRLDNPLRPTD